MAMGFSEHHDERKAPLAKRRLASCIMCYVRKRVRDELDLLKFLESK